MANVRQLKDHGAPIFPITHVSLVKGMEYRALMDATYAWDGTGTPDVSKIPAGVVVTYDGTDYTGTLVASASTTGRFYLVPSTTVQGEWDRYMTDGSGSSYAWKAAGNTSIPSPAVVDNETTDDPTKPHSAAGGKRLKDQLGELEAEVDDVSAQINGVRKPLGIQINKGWMDASAKVTLFDTTTHFVVPIKKGDRIAMKANANKSVYAFLTSYTAPTANGQSYSLCSGTSRVLTSASEGIYIIVPDDAAYLWVGIGDVNGNNFPVSVVLNGVDLVDTKYSQRSPVSILQNTALPSATHIPTFNNDFYVAYARVSKGDRILLKAEANSSASSGGYTVQYAFYDEKPTIGMDSNHILSSGSSSSVYSVVLISNYDGYFAAHFHPVWRNVATDNILDIITVKTNEYIAPGINEVVDEQSNTISFLVHSAMTEPIRRRNTYNTPLFNCHRGVQAFGPENSLPAFLAGGRLNVWAIETDFRITADDKVVCMHDASINRTMVNLDGTVISGTVNVSSKTLAELRANYKIAEVNSTIIPNKQYDYSSFSADELVIPTMDDYFGICQKYGIVPFIELKEDSGVIALMIDAIKRFRLDGRCVISSTSLALLNSYRAQGGKEFIHHIFSSTSSIDTLLKLGNSGLAFDITDFDADITGDYVYKNYNPTTPAELVQMCHSLGLLVCFRAQDSKAAANNAIDVGLDYMPSNNLWEKSQID